MVHFSTAPTAAERFTGILYAEDFDRLDPPEPDPAHEAERGPPPLTQEDLAAACADAVARARREWEQDELRQRTLALEAIKAALASAKDDAAAMVDEAAEALAKTVLACVCSVLPRLCEEHGPAETRALLVRLLPLLRTEPRVLVRVHSELVRPLQELLQENDDTPDGVLTVTPGGQSRADIKVTWTSGSVTRDTRAVLQAVHDSLAQLGFAIPQDAPLKRKLVHAE